MIFDVSNGIIEIDGKALRANMAPDQLAKSGYIFDRNIDMETGWIFRVSTPLRIGAHLIAPALGFHNDKLKRVNFTFLEVAGVPDETLAARHQAFLRKELGEPTRSSPRQIAYEYAWGEVSAEQDPRNGSSYIIITWR